MLLEAAIDKSDRNDYVALAKESAHKYEDLWNALPNELTKTKTSDESCRPLEDYIGKYYNVVQNSLIEIGLVEKNGTKQLFLSFQDLESQKHFLIPHVPDKFSWVLSEEKSRQLERWPALDVTIFVLHFAQSEDEGISKLRWVHDPDVPEVEWFRRI